MKSPSRRWCPYVEPRFALLQCLASGAALLLPLLLQPNSALGQVEPGLPTPADLPGPPTGGSDDSVTCSLSQPWYRCCGPLDYDPFNGTCCGGILVVGSPFAACCGQTAFDADLQGCCSGHVVSRPGRRGRLACCGGVGYDPTVSSCCGTTVIQRSPVTACCGGQPYFFPEPIGSASPGTAAGDVGASGGLLANGPPGSQSSTSGGTVCCGCRLYNVKGYSSQQASCCGNKPYDKATQLCCNGALHSIVGMQSPSCCGAAVVDEMSRGGCCQGRPYQYGIDTPMCCPDGTLGYCCHNPKTNRTVCI